MSKLYYQHILPMNVGSIIPRDSEVFLIEEIFNSLDLSKLYHTKKSNAGRKLKICRERLIMVLIYAYLEGNYSSRDIAEKLTRDINYMYLAENKTLSHDKISKFRKSLKDDVLLDIFKQFVIMLSILNEIKFETVYIDGTKMEANANRYSFVWKKAVSKHEEKLQVKVKKLINKINKDSNLRVTYVFNEDESISVRLMDQILKNIEIYMKRNKIEFKTGKGNRKTKFQRYIEELEDYITRQSKYDFANSVFDGRNSFSKTDLDATFMRLKDDPMKNGQLKPAFNVQMAIEGEYVVGVGVYKSRNDIDTLKPLLDDMKALYGVSYKNCVADSGYFSEKNIDYLIQREMKYFIPYQSYYIEQTRKFKNNIGKKENMTYDQVRDVYICANNRELKFVGVTRDKSDPEYTIEKRCYKSESCNDCLLKDKCMPHAKKNDTNKTITYSPVYEEQKKQALENIKSDEGIKYRINRSIQVEGFFGILKHNYNFRRFMLRGIDNVHLEMLLLAFSFNVRKLHKKIRTGKLGTVTLHEVKDKKAA